VREKKLYYIINDQNNSRVHGSQQNGGTTMVVDADFESIDFGGF
jgi:hypothetical protein